MTRGSYGPEPDASLTPLERAAMAGAREKLGSGDPPEVSNALVLAARELARSAAAGDPDPLSRPRLRAALAAGLSYDPAPAAYLVAAPPDRVVAALARTVAPGPATHVGAGAVLHGGTVHLALLVSRRGASLRPFPREVEPGSRAVLAGRLTNLSEPRVFMTLPSGQSREVTAQPGRAFRAELQFKAAGRYVVEVVGTGNGGPEIAALLAVSCGGAALVPSEPRRLPPAPEPVDPLEAEAAVVRAINASRRRQGLPPLEKSADLQAVARRHSAEMQAHGVVAHVLPGSGDLGERLRRANISFRRAFENVAKGPTALDAHEAAEESPAHRQNILSREATQVGCGIARGSGPAGDPVVYLTEVFAQPLDDISEGPLTPDARVREALWRERAHAGRPPLLADPRLDELARDSARSLLRRGALDKDLSERAARLGHSLTAIDSFVGPSPEAPSHSPNLRDPRFRRVGIGVAVGDNARFGAGLLYVAVIYTD